MVSLICDANNCNKGLKPGLSVARLRLDESSLFFFLFFLCLSLFSRLSSADDSFFCFFELSLSVGTATTGLVMSTILPVSPPACLWRTTPGAAYPTPTSLLCHSQFLFALSPILPRKTNYTSRFTPHDKTRRETWTHTLTHSLTHTSTALASILPYSDQSVEEIK